MNPFKYDLVRYTRGVGIEISEDTQKMFPHFIKWNLEAVHLLRKHSMDFSCITTKEFVLEDIIQLFSVVKCNGYFIIIVPLTIDILEKFTDILGWQLIETLKNDEASCYVFKQTCNTSQRIIKPIEGKKCAVLRYGGIGDMMMASIIFPELKKQGYRVTLYTHVNSYEVVKYNPHIDEVVLQDSGQVPIEEFRDFCLHTSKKYDKFINLSESIEGTLLSLPDRVSYYWPKEVRHNQMKGNYYELTAAISSVQLSLQGNFYMTPKEEFFAINLRKKLKTPIILWVLSGSSVHKFWPWQDQAIARILVQHPTATIVLAGDVSSKLLQQGWEKEPRVVLTCGEWSVRETMAFCYFVDLIVTPETGVALAVQFKDIPKILLHSHSSPSNYAESWVNCTSITPDDCECYPCHQMHYGFNYCNTVELYGDDNDKPATVSKCQVNINVDKVTEAINRSLL